MIPFDISSTAFMYRKKLKFSTQVESSVPFRQKVSYAIQPSREIIPRGTMVLSSTKKVLLYAVSVELV